MARYNSINAGTGSGITHHRRARPPGTARRPRPDAAADPGAAVVAFRAAERTSGKSEPLASLMTRFGPTMARVARRYVHSPQDVEDAVQDAWVAFARAADGIETPAAIAGWLCTTTARSALAIAQRQRRCAPAEGSVLDVATAPVDSSVLEATDEVAAVRAAVARLSRNEQELVGYLFHDRLSYDEIASRTGRAVGGIGPTRQRIITRLRHDTDVCRHLAS